MTLQSAKNYEELLTAGDPADPYDYPVLFKVDGFFGRQSAKRRFKLLRGIDPKLRGILRPQERVYYVTTGTTVSVLEHLFVGWIAHQINLRALIFTTERILLLAVNGVRPGALVSQVPYLAIASVRSTWTGTCRVKLLNRQTFNFQRVPKADRKFIADFLADVVKGTNAPFQPDLGLEHLCPHCYAVVAGRPPACPSCQGEFKSANRAALRSFIFPGAGSWYLGHRGHAVLEFLGALYLWIVLVIGPLLPAGDAGNGAARVDSGYWATAAVILLVAHGLDAVMTRHFALKGHYAEKTPVGLAHQTTAAAK